MARDTSLNFYKTISARAKKITLIVRFNRYLISRIIKLAMSDSREKHVYIRTNTNRLKVKKKKK